MYIRSLLVWANATADIRARSISGLGWLSACMARLERLVHPGLAPTVAQRAANQRGHFAELLGVHQLPHGLANRGHLLPHQGQIGRHRQLGEILIPGRFEIHVGLGNLDLGSLAHRLIRCRRSRCRLGRCRLRDRLWGNCSLWVGLLRGGRLRERKQQQGGGAES